MELPEWLTHAYVHRHDELMTFLYGLGMSHREIADLFVPPKPERERAALLAASLGYTQAAVCIGKSRRVVTRWLDEEQYRKHLELNMLRKRRRNESQKGSEGT